MSFYEHVSATHNKHGDGDVYKLPCNRYMVYSKQFNKCYLNDPGVARYITAMSNIFDKFGLKDAKFEYFSTYNTMSVENPRPLGQDRIKPEELPRILEVIKKCNVGTIFENFKGTCKEFYREFDSTCACCPICGYNEDRTTSHVDDEEILIAYLLSDPETFNRVKPFYDEHKDEMFKSMFDLHYNKYLDYKSNKPFMFHFYKTFCSVILSYEDIAYFVNEKEAAETDFKNTFFDYMDENYHYNENPDLAIADDIDLKLFCSEFLDRFIYRPSVTNAKGFNVAYKNITGKDIRIEDYNTTVAYSFSEPAATNDDVDDDYVLGSDDSGETVNDAIEPEDNLADISETDELKNTTLPTPDDAEVSEIDEETSENDEGFDETVEDLEEPEDEDTKSVEEPIVEDVPEDIVTEDYGYDPAMDGYMPEEMPISEDAAQFYDAMAEEYEPVDESDKEAPIEDVPADEMPFSDDEPVKEVTETSEPTTALAVTGTTEVTTDIEDDSDVTLHENEEDTWAFPVKTLGEDNFIIDNHIDNLKDYGIIPIDNDKWYLMQFESSVLTNTYMCVEAVTDSDGNDYLVFFDRMRKTYFSVQMSKDSECMEIIKPYLTRNKYIKICFQPYHLYAFGRKYDIELKKIFSIQTCYSFFTKDWPLVGYEETINFFIDNPLSEYAPRNIPMLLVGMQMYPTICARCSKKLDSPQLLNEVDAMRYFDEAMGRSYYVGDLYEKTGDIPPFKLTGPNQYEFTTEERGNTLVEGEYFTCTFLIDGKHEITEDDSWTMIKGAIEMLAGKGRFRKLHIYITYMTKTTLKLFVPKYNVSYMETSIMSVFSEVNRVKLNNKKYKMMFRQDEATAVKAEQTEKELELDKDEEDKAKE